MLCMTIKNLIAIYYGLKVMTLRPIKPDHKGYFKINSLQMLKLNRFDKFFYLRVKIINREIINLDDLKKDDFKKLGYKNKAAYMNEPFNKNNDSKYRVKYTFEIVEINQTKMNEIL